MSPANGRTKLPRRAPDSIVLHVRRCWAGRKGYAIRSHEPADEAPFLRLMDEGGFERWDEETLRFNPDGIIATE